MTKIEITRDSSTYSNSWWMNFCRAHDNGKSGREWEIDWDRIGATLEQYDAMLVMYDMGGISHLEFKDEKMASLFILTWT